MKPDRLSPTFFALASSLASTRRGRVMLTRSMSLDC
jgi:hypothetical protein